MNKPRSERNIRREKLLLIIGFYTVLFLFIVGCCVGCVTIPQPLEDGVHLLHSGNILISEDYSELLIRHYQGDERDNKLKLLEAHLKLSEQLNKYVEGKGGKIVLPWTKPKEVDE